ncbi:hypothetical protein VSX61_08785 [Brenneria populi subsp. brevivirga]|uniref:hypothetical protein n=1 Tax=Brenneria populi TaxID=1505588 RepID=UPI002E196A37|nr:hypothetical protein [Brenneria populi subsp. brevivirga]
MPQQSTATLPVFRPGTHTAMDGRTVTLTLDDCLDLASSYDPALAEAPFVIGHPSLTAPAYGWAKRFEVRDGLVYAEPRQVVPAFAEAFNAGQYKKRSLSIYLPNSPGNPKPGHHYARHIGFLGAVPPAVKGLPDVQFSEASGENAPLEFAIPWETELLTDMFRSLRDYLVEKEGAERADQILPQWRLKSIEEAAARTSEPQISQLAYAEETDVSKENPNPNPAADFAAREASLVEREARIQAQEQAQQEAAAKQRRADIVSFADGLAKDGRILPRQKNSVVEVLVNLSAEPISFADGNATVSKTPEILLREILGDKPTLLDFSEKTPPAGDGAVDFADAESIAAAAQAYQAEQQKLGRAISITAAVHHIKGNQK